MISSGFEENRQIKSDGAQIQPSEQVGNTFRELHQLLELYAPMWYTEELHNQAETALRVLGKGSKAIQAVDETKDLTHPPVYD
jgi:hypothetical protein